MCAAVASNNTDNLGSGPSSVSRSGRVRKKSSLLAEYESLDNFDKPRKKYDKEKTPKSREKNPIMPKVTLKIGTTDTPRRPMKKGPKGKKMKLDNSGMGMKSDRDYLDDEEGELEIDLPPEFQSSMPMLGAEEIIDEELLDEEDGATEVAENTSINRLKSQAESTYFMEKSLEKNRKSIQGVGGQPGRVKQTRKDKGSSRVTAYMLWSKEQRSIFDKKNVNVDFPQMSKKLSDLWATVPQNQKKMWKNKAAKMMKKNANLSENMKNSTPGAASKSMERFTPVKKTPQAMKETAMNQKGQRKSPQPTLMPKTSKGPPSRSPGKGKGVVGTSNTKAPPKGRQSSGAQPNRSYYSPSSPEFSEQTNVQISKKGPGRNSYSNSLNNGHSSKYSAPLQLKQTQQYSPRKEEDSTMYKVTGTAPIDVAAHFSLLGESLSIIGERLKEHEGQTVSGSLSVLLDSLLCACGPLLCLTQQVPELNCVPPEKLTHILDNIAYIMPGL